MRVLLLTIMLLLTALVWAAENPVAQEPQSEQTQQAEDPDNDQQETELVLDETETDEDEESPERFIPTEEISQDLGVSFPVDI